MWRIGLLIAALVVFIVETLRVFTRVPSESRSWVPIGLALMTLAFLVADFGLR